MRDTMNPFWYCMRVGMFAAVTAAGTAMIAKKLCPKPRDLIAGAIHFKKGMDEFQKGLVTVFLGSPEAEDAEAAEKRKESSRIPIE